MSTCWLSRCRGCILIRCACCRAVDETLVQLDDQQQTEQVQEQQQQQATAGPSIAEIEFQETLIAERENEIREIESGIHELNEIFRDLGHIVQEQGGMIGKLLR